jgi:hypothetical protein
MARARPRPVGRSSACWVEPAGHQPLKSAIRLIPESFRAPSGLSAGLRRICFGVERLQRLDRASAIAAAAAQDLNDHLTVILSSVTSLLVAMEPGHPARLPLVDLERAALRCATTASRLLKFSARRGARPARTDLEAVLEELA